MKKMLNISLALLAMAFIGACDDEDPQILNEKNLIVFDIDGDEIDEGDEPYTIKILGSDVGASSTVSISGTAVEGEDYTTTFTNPVVIKDSYSFEIVITPVDDNVKDGDKTVILHLDNGGYSPNTDEGKDFVLVLVDNED